MKKAICFITTILLMSLLPIGCDDNTEEILNKIYINDEEIEFHEAFIHDLGTNFEITHRKYKLSFQTPQGDYPKNFITFTIVSPSTTGLEEGFYEYTSVFMIGTINSVKFGKGITYDDALQAIDGLRISDASAQCEGNIDIRLIDRKYHFTLDLELTQNDSTYKITGEYNAGLKEADINL